eukprot:jgi/Astpho2/8419/Aster-07607
MIGTMPPETGIPWPACSQVEVEVGCLARDRRQSPLCPARQVDQALECLTSNLGEAPRLSQGCLTLPPAQGLASRSPILLADHHLSLSASCVDARDALWKGSEC